MVWITGSLGLGLRSPSESARPDTESAPKNPNTQFKRWQFLLKTSEMASFASHHRTLPASKECFLSCRSSSHPTTLRCGLRVPLRFRASQSDAYQAVACFRTRWPAQPGLEANINGAGHGPLPRGFAPMTNMHIDTQAKSKQLTAQRETLIIPAM